MNAKFIGVGIGALVVMVIGVAIIAPLVNQISATTDLGGSGSPLSSLMSLFPIVVAIGLIMAVAGMFMGGGDYTPSTDTDDEEVEYEEPEPVSVKRKDAERIIMERFARGEITEEVYTSMMARL